MIDADGDAVGYEWEVFNAGGLVWTSSSSGPAVSAEVPGRGVWQWRVRATDGFDASAWSDAVTFTAPGSLDNTPPAAPELVRPEDGASDLGVVVEVEWADADDADGDPLTYDIEVNATADPETIVFALDAIPDDEEATLIAVVDGLTGATDYQVRVRASDPWAASEWATIGFTTANRAPAVPALVEPVDGVMIEDDAVVLVVDAGRDPDGHDLTIEIEVAAGPDAEMPTERFETIPVDADGVASVTFEPPDIPSQWVWRARAIDALGDASDWSGYEAFGVEMPAQNLAPGAPMLIAPSDGATLPPGDVTFTFEPGDDPDGDAVAHQLVVVDADGQTVATIDTFDGDETLSAEWALDAAGSYTWMVTATDEAGLSGPPSEVWTVVIEAEASDAGGGDDVGLDAGGDTRAGTGRDGCGCSTQPATGSTGGLLLLGALVGLARRRRSVPRRNDREQRHSWV